MILEGEFEKDGENLCNSDSKHEQDVRSLDNFEKFGWSLENSQNYEMLVNVYCGILLF